MKDGVQKKIRRTTTSKLHEMLPQDEVTLTSKKNDDFQVDDSFKVKHINQRHPNVLQLENDEGKTTFVDYYDKIRARKLGERSDGTLGLGPSRRTKNTYSGLKHFSLLLNVIFSASNPLIIKLFTFHPVNLFSLSYIQGSR